MGKLQYRIGKKVIRKSIMWARNTWVTLSNHTDYENNRVYIALSNKMNERKHVELPVLDVGG